jgi:uncharacterized membrane protein HdeD (DUF308 family)
VTARVLLSLVLGVLMLVLGVFLSVRPFWAHGVPFTGARWLDVAFALVFVLRGLMNVSSARSKMRKQNVP